MWLIFSNALRCSIGRGRSTACRVRTRTVSATAMDWNQQYLPPCNGVRKSGILFEPSPRIASIRSEHLDQLAEDIRDRGDQHAILEVILPELHNYVSGDPHRRCQLQQCSFVPTLMSCVRTAPTPELRRIVLSLLREITIGMTVYPDAIEDSHFVDLTISLNEVPERVVECLEVLRELTRFPHGKRAVISNDIHVVLARIISTLHYQEVLIPAIEILVNVSGEKFRCRTVLSAGIFNAFKKAAGNCLLLHHQKREFQVAQANSDVFSLMIKFQMMSDEQDQQNILRLMIQECEHYCCEVLSEWTGVLIQWSRFMELCTKDDDVVSEAIRLGFIENSQVIVRYGEINSLGTLIQALTNVSAKFNAKYNIEIVNVGLIETLLERFPIHELRQVLVMDSNEGHHYLDRRTVVNIFCLISNVLTTLPARFENSECKKNIVEFLLERDITQLLKLLRSPMNSRIVLEDITLKLSNLAEGWSVKEVLTDGN